MFIKLLPPNNNVETSDFKLDFADPPPDWVWSEQEEELDMSRRSTKRSSESVEDCQELKHQLFDKVFSFYIFQFVFFIFFVLQDVETLHCEMSGEKAVLESQLQDVQLKLAKAAEEKENIEAQLQKWSAEKLEKEAELSGYTALSEECGKKIASCSIILTGFSEYISYKEKN